MMLAKNKTEENASTAKIAFWYVISSIFTKGLAMLSTPVFTRLMSQSEYGRFSNFTSWESIITIIVTFDLGSSIARAKYDFSNKMDDYIASVLLFGNLVTIVSYLFIEIRPQFFCDLFSMDIIYIRALFMYLLFSPAFSHLQIKHRIYRKYKFCVFFSVFSAVVRTIISILLVFLLADKFKGRILGYLVPITILNVALWVSVFLKGRRISWSYMKYACRISIPLIPHALSGIFLINSDRIMITKYCGNEATALYSIAYSISMIASLIWNSMNRAWSPWLFDNMNANNRASILEKSKIFLGVFIIFIIGVFLTAPEIILILGGKQYYSARYIMPPVIVGCVFQFIYSMYVNIEIYSKKTFIISIGTMAAAMLNLFLNYLFIPRYGYAAASYTTMTGYLALLIFHYYIVKITLKEYIDMYDRKFIFQMAMLTVVLGCISFALFKYNYIRYIASLIYAILLLKVLYKFRKQLKNIL